MSQSLGNIVKIMNCLSCGTNRFTEICQEVGLPRSTVHRLLSSMVDSGLSVQDPVSRLYYIGPVIFNLASNPTMAHQHLIVTAQNEIKWLNRVTQETIALHVLMGTYQICLDELVSSEPIKFMIGRGEMALACFGASGKMLLSQLNDNELGHIKDKFDKLNKGSRTLSVFDEMSEIRKKGYAKSQGERKPGAAVYSMSVKNYYSPIALSVMGPENRIIEKEAIIIQSLKEASERLSEQLKEQS